MVGQRRVFSRIRLLLLALIALPAGPAAAQPGYVSLSVEPGAFTGNFGGTQNLSVYEQQVALRYHGTDWQVGVEVPMLEVTGMGALTSGGSSYGTRTGLGDVWLGGDVRLDTPQGWRPAVIPYARLKLPTASVAKGLGTGQPDAELGSRLEWRLTPHIYPFAQVGYRIDGRVAKLNIQSAPVLAGGVALLGPDRTTLTLVFEEHGQFQTGSGQTQIAMLALSAPLFSRFSLQGFVLRGFTSANAAYGAGLGLSARF